MDIVIKFFTFLLFIASAYSDDFCYFKPPVGWEAQINPTSLTKIIYSAPNTSSMARVGFAMEPLSSPLSLTEYLVAVKTIHESDPQKKWRDLGTYRVRDIEGRLTEIEIKSETQDIRQMQFIFVKNQSAYIITSSALKSEFGKYYSDFQSVLKSVRLTSNLFEALPSEEQKQRIMAAQKIALARGAESWAPFEKLVTDEFTEMGSFWQYLVLVDTVEQLKGMPNP